MAGDLFYNVFSVSLEDPNFVAIKSSPHLPQPRFLPRGGVQTLLPSHFRYSSASSELQSLFECTITLVRISNTLLLADSFSNLLARSVSILLLVVVLVIGTHKIERN